MRITCPNCTAGFEIPTELLGRKGRSLKCATCGHSWFQAAIVDEIDLADVLAESKAKETAKDMGGTPGRRTPDTAAIAAAANEAIGKPTDPSILPPAPSGGLGTAGGPAPKPQSDVPEGAKSLLDHRKSEQQQPRGQATSMRDDGGASGGPQAAPLKGQSLKGQSGVDGVGDEGQSWFDNQDAPVTGASGGPGAAPAQAAPASDGLQAPDAGAAGGAPAPPQAGAQGGPPAPPPNAAGAPPQGTQSTAFGGHDAGASGGPGAAPGAPQGAPSKSMRDDASMKAPGEAAVSWLERDSAAAGAPGMPGMPGAIPAPLPGMPGAPTQAGAMGGPGATGGPPAGASGGPAAAPLPGQSMMNKDPLAGPGGAAVSQLSGEQVQGPGLGARSMLTGEQSAPGAAGASQMGGDIDAPGDVARSLLDGEERSTGGGAQGGPPEEGASGGPGQSMLGDEDASGSGAEGGPESGGASAGASGGPGGAPDNDDLDDDPLGDDDDDAFFQGEKGSGEDELDEDPLVGADDDDDAFFQGEKGAGDDEEDGGQGGADDDDDAFFQGEKGSGDEDDLIDPDDDRPDFGGTSGESEDDDLDEDPLDGLIDEEKPKPEKKKKKKSKPIDPAYITAAVLTVVVLLLGSLLFAARDQLSKLWPGIEGVYEALNLEDEQKEGLRLSAPQPVRIMKGGVQTLVVTGFVTNLTEEVKTVPDIKLMLINKDNDVVQETSGRPSAPTIDPNSTLPYRIELQLPVETATSLQVDWN